MEAESERKSTHELVAKSTTQLQSLRSKVRVYAQFLASDLSVEFAELSSTTIVHPVVTAIMLLSSLDFNLRIPLPWCLMHAIYSCRSQTLQFVLLSFVAPLAF